jgi:hypothetical protein
MQNTIERLMQERFESKTKSLFYASACEVWFDLEMKDLFGVTRESRHGLVVQREEHGLTSAWQMKRTWFGLIARKEGKLILAHLMVLVLAVAWFAM